MVLGQNLVGVDPGSSVPASGSQDGRGGCSQIQRSASSVEQEPCERTGPDYWVLGVGDLGRVGISDREVSGDDVARRPDRARRPRSGDGPWPGKFPAWRRTYNEQAAAALRYAIGSGVEDPEVNLIAELSQICHERAQAFQVPRRGQPWDVLHQEGQRAYLVDDPHEMREPVATVCAAELLTAGGPWLAWRPSGDDRDAVLIPLEVVAGDIPLEDLRSAVVATVRLEGICAAVRCDGYRQAGCLQAEGQSAGPAKASRAGSGSVTELYCRIRPAGLIISRGVACSRSGIAAGASVGRQAR